jgi:hypothetical protein
MTTTEQRAQALADLIALIDRGEPIRLVHDDPRYGETRTYLRAGPKERSGFWVIVGDDHRTRKVGPTELRGFIGADLHQGWHQSYDDTTDGELPD